MTPKERLERIEKEAKLHIEMELDICSTKYIYSNKVLLSIQDYRYLLQLAKGAFPHEPNGN